MEGNKKKVLWLIVILLGVCVIAFGVYAGFKDGLFGGKSGEVSNNDNKNNNTKTEDKEIAFNGVYEYEGTTIKLYQTDKKTLYYDISYDEGAGSITSNAKISGKSASDEMFDTNYKFTITETGLEFTSNSEDLKSGTYTKKTDYTVSDYFTDNYGDVKYLNNKYNGEYTFGDIKAYMYQSDEEEVRLYLYGGPGMSDLRYEIGKDGVLTCEHFDDKYEVTLGDNSFTLKVVEGESSEFAGTYTKVKTMTMEDIIANLN